MFDEAGALTADDEEFFSVACGDSVCELSQRRRQVGIDLARSLLPTLDELGAQEPYSVSRNRPCRGWG